MPNFNPSQVKSIEGTPANNPKAVHQALGNIVLSSSTCRCKVENVNPNTGEYRIVLTGTLTSQPSGNPSSNTGPSSNRGNTGPSGNPGPWPKKQGRNQEED